jgi:formylglycine-generating enzyme required for sulfatase activity
MKFVPVPITGGPTGGKRVLFSIWETRVQDYEVFAKETQREWPKPDFAQEPTHPAVNVSWEDATAFCAWLTERERKACEITAREACRLPSDHEWSCAAGLGSREDPAALPRLKSQQFRGEFPWGAAWPPPAGGGNFADRKARDRGVRTEGDYLGDYDDGYPYTAPVGTFSANELGLFDLGGNAWEWCEDWMDAAQQKRVRRGASYYDCAAIYVLSSIRISYPPANRSPSTSFRVVLAPVN